MNDKLKNSELKSILIIESNEDEVKRFVDVVQNNCDAKVTSFKSSVEAILWLQNNFADIIILEEGLQPMSVTQTIEYIQNELGKNAPIFISSTKKSAKNDEKLLQKPFTLEGLQKLCNKKIEVKQDALHFSLDYLTEISDGNTEFICGSIEIFKTSVSEQILLLEKALENQDHKKVGEIAHHIKPSFEMLLNDEAAGLCNQLIYKFNASEAPVQIKELRKIFEKIKKELETDFTLKKS
ncbi:Hpt domain-containing protein [Autumnicola edwardsiae]|uniref:Hpt domain-containing protein n=1 Tax=Autumnicola edwardsiae TaxID=3075594 RepID=A0ABU3CSH7_9FLAO|nr:Hpt domain-containing protein [Zunongwangia sp. F297]MDT0649313.1 Hpt domain-containing protein [Zunongwangia sp. F297]